MTQSPDAHAGKRHLWPIFICYRQVDGLAAARRLHELLDKHDVAGPHGETIELDVYLDQTMPAVADWREIHRPYLEKACALIVVCTPGAKIVDGPEDWVHKEINWWLAHRDPVPILVDPLRQGIRYVPTSIRERWSEIQRIPLVESEWSHLAPAELEQKASPLRRQIVGNILPSGAAIYDQELKAERKRAEELSRALRGRTRALAGVIAFVVVALAATGYAVIKQRDAQASAQAAEISQRVSQASLYDAQAGSFFEQARRIEARWESLKQRQIEISRGLNGLGSGEQPTLRVRRQNLNFESQQLEQSMKGLAATAMASRKKGYAELKLADDAWRSLESSGQSVAPRTRPEPPFIFSIELISSARGESILIHYGPPDATRLVMVNSGTEQAFADSVGRRLQSLRTQRFGNAPVPIELFVGTDQDFQKTGGLRKMLLNQAEVGPKSRLVELRRVWVNLFSSFGFRGAIRALLEMAGIPLNDPFDHLVMRPERGRLVHKLSDDRDDMELVILGPAQTQLRDLFEFSSSSERQQLESGRQPSARPITSLPEEHSSRMRVLEVGDPMSQPPVTEGGGSCAPSHNAQTRADVNATDRSIPNLASTVRLFRYRGRTFLHTGDSRADLIMADLRSSGLMGVSDRAHVNLLHLPHLGSNRNLTPEFLERVTADEYLFTGDGTFADPRIETIAALIAARPCADYTMYFVNRDSTVRQSSESKVTHAESLDMFFAAEQEFGPRYRRVFRATDQGSVIIDLLDRLTY